MMMDMIVMLLAVVLAAGMAAVLLYKRGSAVAVYLGFPLFGGALGGVLIVLGTSVFDYWKEGGEAANVWKDFADIAPLAAWFGFVTGWPPAALTGAVLAWRKTVICGWRTYAWIAALGAAAGFIYACVLMYFLRDENGSIWDTELLLLFGAAGAAAAAILAKVLLPKAKACAKAV